MTEYIKQRGNHRVITKDAKHKKLTAAPKVIPAQDLLDKKSEEVEKPTENVEAPKPEEVAGRRV